ncbi:MAG: hypothetical protein KME26_31370 [Oscillatoria princeps RMCB-10]|nr:hypothetical protein [Oscillatoria princeps RMCB-10]
MRRGRCRWGGRIAGEKGAGGGDCRRKGNGWRGLPVKRKFTQGQTFARMTRADLVSPSPMNRQSLRINRHSVRINRHSLRIHRQSVRLSRHWLRTSRHSQKNSPDCSTKTAVFSWIALPYISKKAG